MDATARVDFFLALQRPVIVVLCDAPGRQTFDTRKPARLFNLTEGAVRNVDGQAKNLIIRHGEIELLAIRR